MDGLILYKLVGHLPVKCSLDEYGAMMASEDRVVARDEAVPGVVVSTVFLGIDHSFGRGAPMLFETMTFTEGLPGQERQYRYSTWEQAEQGHAAVTARVVAAAAASIAWDTVGGVQQKKGVDADTDPDEA